LKLGSTRFWLSVSLLLPAFSIWTTGPSNAPGLGRPLKRQNELTLAGIRPGQDFLTNLIKRYKRPIRSAESTPKWLNVCGREELSADLDSRNQVQVLRVSATRAFGDCAPVPPSNWRTGRGLRIGDSCARPTDIYGNPDSRGPSTRDGQPLELLYYAFDWAGPDVPQVMQVVCTVEKNGQAGRVVQITLAASSL
jgi:hypothetical protein